MFVLRCISKYNSAKLNKHDDVIKNGNIFRVTGPVCVWGGVCVWGVWGVGGVGVGLGNPKTQKHGCEQNC